ncbi:Retrotransposon-derived protein PEG10 [Labeo rohita]|uniref:Retrotransposon-derived protein PEG10 n=1 Tax=Labeo rohita TaxID=84645 RepID=A0ABQ8MVK2_LABRO|nr:Retrotransposon-derived protein PEG10 [Labeo rohita]
MPQTKRLQSLDRTASCLRLKGFSSQLKRRQVSGLVQLGIRRNGLRLKGIRRSYEECDVKSHTHVQICHIFILLPTRSLWLPPTTISGNHHRTFNALHYPSPRTWDPHFRFQVLGSLPLWRPFIDRQVGGLPREVLVSLSINPERFPFVYCFIVADWTVYSLCMIHCRLPRPIAWTIVYSVDYLRQPCLLLIELCLLNSTVLIKLSQMDPTPPDQSLTASQKTSPPSDPATAQAPPSTSPATVLQITLELTAQASTLLLHQQQLDRLTDFTGQLVRALQGLQLAPPPAPTPVTTPPPGAQSAAASPRLAFPEKFDGSPEKCKGFLLQCSLFISQQPHLYPSDECKIAFVCSLLSGRALEWATAVWRLDRSTFPSFTTFIQRFKKVFQPSAEDGEAGEQIMALRQGRRTAADYALSFRTLVAQSGWCDGPLKLHYRKGLHPDLQVELACRDEGLSLEEFIDLSMDKAFSRQKATQLPPHRLGDCAIELLPGATPTRGRIFPLSQAESAAMETYIQEELAKGFIRPSTSPASAGFFFVKKKDGGL